MMIAVLIDARNPGSSGWVAVRHTRKIRIVGMGKGSLVEIRSDKGLICAEEDIDIDIPNGVESVKAEILKIGEGSRISIDLE